MNANDRTLFDLLLKDAKIRAAMGPDPADHEIEAVTASLELAIKVVESRGAAAELYAQARETVHPSIAPDIPS